MKNFESQRRKKKYFTNGKKNKNFKTYIIVSKNQPCKTKSIIAVYYFALSINESKNKRSNIDENQRSILSPTLAPKSTMRISIFIEIVSQIVCQTGRSISLHYAWVEIALFHACVEQR